MRGTSDPQSLEEPPTGSNQNGSCCSNNNNAEIDEATIAEARRTAFKPTARFERRDSTVDASLMLAEDARKQSDGKPLVNSAYAEIHSDGNGDDHTRSAFEDETTTTTAIQNRSNSRPPKPEIESREAELKLALGQLPETDLVHKPGSGHPPVAPSARAPELPHEDYDDNTSGGDRGSKLSNNSAIDSLMPKPAKTPSVSAGPKSELKENSSATAVKLPQRTQQQQQTTTTTTTTTTTSVTSAATAGDPDLESPARDVSKPSAAAAPSATATAASDLASKKKCGDDATAATAPAAAPAAPAAAAAPASAPRSIIVKRDALPVDQRYWGASNVNPWHEGGIGTGMHHRPAPTSPVTAAPKRPPAHGRRSNNNNNNNNVQPSPPAKSPFPFEHLVETSENATTIVGLKKGAVDIASTHRPLPGKKCAAGHAIHRPEYDNVRGSRRLEEMRQIENSDNSPLTNFVRIPAATRPAKIADKLRNADARRREPEILHVDETKNSGIGGASADELEKLAVKLLVGADVGSPSKRGDKDSGRMALISPRRILPQQGQRGAIVNDESSPSDQFRPSRAAAAELLRDESRKSNAVAASTQRSFSRQLLQADAGLQGGGGGGGDGSRFVARPSIPSKDRPVAHELRNSEVQVYEAYDRGFAERKLARLARVGRNTIATHDTASSRLYQQQNKAPEGFCSTEDAIVQLARQHEARKYNSNSNNSTNNSFSTDSRDIRSMESLLGIAVNHRNLAVSTRNLARASKPVVPRSIPPPNHRDHLLLPLVAPTSPKQQQQLLQKGAAPGIVTAATTARVGASKNNNSSNNSAAPLVLSSATKPVYPPLVVRDGTDAWLQQQGLGTLRQAQMDADERKGRSNLLMITDGNGAETSSEQLQQQGQQQEQKQQQQQQQQQLALHQLRPDGIQAVMVPSAVAGAPPRIIGYYHPGNNNNNNSSNGFSLTPRLNQICGGMRPASDVNYSQGPHLPCAPVDTPRRFAELMQSRLQLAMQVAAPLNVAVAPQRQAQPQH